MLGGDILYEQVASTPWGQLALSVLFVATSIILIFAIKVMNGLYKQVKETQDKLEEFTQKFEELSHIFEAPENDQPIKTYQLRNGHATLNRSIEELRTELRNGFKKINEETSSLCNPRECNNLIKFDEKIAKTGSTMVKNIEDHSSLLRRFEDRLSRDADSIRADIKGIREEIKRMTDSFGGAVTTMVERLTNGK
jgi:hypothetical protein